MLRFLGLIFLLCVGFVIFSNHDKDGASSSAPAKPQLTDAQCREDLQCYADKFQANATVDCRRPVEQRAKNDFQWTDAWYEQKFDHRRWQDQAKGLVEYVGDHIKFQNGFGAWTYMTYYCAYDTINKNVDDVIVIEGRLSNSD